MGILYNNIIRLTLVFIASMMSCLNYFYDVLEWLTGRQMFKLDEKDVVKSLPDTARSYLYEDKHVHANFQRLMTVNKLSGLTPCARAAAIDSYYVLLENGIYFRDKCLSNQTLISSEATITRPLFIVGMTRSGAELLQNVLNCDSQLYCQTYKHMCPGIGSIRPTTTVASILYNVESILRKKCFHKVATDSPEDLSVLFLSFGLDSASRLGSLCSDYIAKWMESLDTSTYEEFYTKIKRHLLYLQHTHSPGSKHVVVSQHLRMTKMEAICKVFPDAVFIHTIRDPKDVVGVSCSMTSGYLKHMHPRPTLAKHGSLIMKDLAYKASEYVRFRRLNGENFTFVDVRYNDIIADSPSVVKKIHQAAGLSVTAVLEEKLQTFSDQNKTYASLQQQCSLEQYGLNADIVDDAFKSYKEFFSI